MKALKVFPTAMKVRLDMREKKLLKNKENGIDIDYDDDLEERFSHDVSAVITLLKPHAIVRLDTSEQKNSDY